MSAVLTAARPGPSPLPREERPTTEGSTSAKSHSCRLNLTKRPARCATTCGAEGSSAVSSPPEHYAEPV